jgi:hypothetical protein
MKKAVASFHAYVLPNHLTLTHPHLFSALLRRLTARATILGLLVPLSAHLVSLRLPALGDLHHSRLRLELLIPGKRSLQLLLHCGASCRSVEEIAGRGLLPLGLFVTRSCLLCLLGRLLGNHRLRRIRLGDRLSVAGLRRTGSRVELLGLIVPLGTHLLLLRLPALGDLRHGSLRLELGALLQLSLKLRLHRRANRVSVEKVASLATLHLGLVALHLGLLLTRWRRTALAHDLEVTEVEIAKRLISIEAVPLRQCRNSLRHRILAHVADSGIDRVRHHDRGRHLYWFD